MWNDEESFIGCGEFDELAEEDVSGVQIHTLPISVIKTGDIPLVVRAREEDIAID